MECEEAPNEPQSGTSNYNQDGQGRNTSNKGFMAMLGCYSFMQQLCQYLCFEDLTNLALVCKAAFTIVPKTRAFKQKKRKDFKDVLTCDLVMEKMCQYLSFEDLKNLSSISRAAFYAVRKTKVFSNNARFRICKSSLVSGVLENSFYSWKHFLVTLPFRDSLLDILTPSESIIVLPDFLEYVHSISFQVHNLYKGSHEDVKVSSIEMLKETNFLRELEVDSTSFENLLKGMFCYERVEQAIRNLDSLSISYIRRAPSFAKFPDVKFKLNKFSLEDFDSGSEKFNTFILKIVEDSKETLEELVVHYGLWQLQGMKYIRCPNLKKLTMSFYQDRRDFGVVQMFLRNQPSLEELIIADSNSVSAIDLLLCLKGRMSKLRKLDITAKERKPKLAISNHRFLDTMTSLEELRITLIFKHNSCEFLDIEEIIRELPPNTVKRIVITEDADSYCCVNPYIGRNLSRFTNMTELTLVRVIEFFDASLQSIIENCPNLTKVVLDDLPFVSDYGISGVMSKMNVAYSPTNNYQTAGVSLSELKKLDTLKISNCRGITMAGLLSVTQFSSLLTFHFDFYNKDGSWLFLTPKPKDFVFQILEQNPRLTDLQCKLALGTSFSNCDILLEMEVRKFFPHIQRLAISHNYVLPEHDHLMKILYRIDEKRRVRTAPVRRGLVQN